MIDDSVLRNSYGAVMLPPVESAIVGTVLDTDGTLVPRECVALSPRLQRGARYFTLTTTQSVHEHRVLTLGPPDRATLVIDDEGVGPTSALRAPLELRVRHSRGTAAMLEGLPERTH